jgi:hypothetical protein
VQPPSVNTNPHRSPARRSTRARSTAAALLVAAAFGVGCHHTHKTSRVYTDPNAPPQVVTGPATPYAPKPMPGGDVPVLPTPANDPAIVREQLPEELAFVPAYNSIGKPRLMVFVNRTVTGELLPVQPAAGVAVSADRPVVYLQPGQYDQAQAGAIDYQLVEDLLAEDLSAGGKVTMIAPLGARQRLTEDDVRDIQAGRAQMLGELVAKLNADVLIQVTAHPSEQTAQGLGIRLVAEAVNTRGGQAIGFASADVAAPLTKDKLNTSVRFMARKLMGGMTDAWVAMANPQPAAPVTPPPVSPPQPTVAPVQPPVTPPPAANPLAGGAAVPPPTAPSPVVPPPPILTPAVTPPPAPVVTAPVVTPPPVVVPPVADSSATNPLSPPPTTAPSAPATAPSTANPLDLPPPP